MKLYANTDIGQKRQINQDTFFINQYSDNAGFAIVCDGMGGQNAGNIASEIACKSITDLMIANDLSLVPKEEIKDFLISVISQGNLLVYEKSLENDDYFGMGTTLVLALVIDKNAYIAHIGDSRAYISNDKGLIQITKDHSLVQELLDNGTITNEEAFN
ncbi:MAG: protein phosphatase 2C domain-containing protein, partial [Oscillospiraceae bacterium]